MLLWAISAALAAAEVAVLVTFWVAVLLPVLTVLPAPPVTAGVLLLVSAGLAVAAEVAVWAAVAVWVEVCCAIADAGQTKAPTLIAAARNFNLMLLRSPWFERTRPRQEATLPPEGAID